MKVYISPKIVVCTFGVTPFMAASYDQAVFNGSADTNTSDIMEQGEEAGVKSSYFYDGFE